MTLPMRATISALHERLRPCESPYFVALREGRLPRAGFVDSQVEFFFAVAHFAAPMQALAARVKDERAREVLRTNIADEQGGGNPAHSHRETFLELLVRLGVPRAVVLARAPGPVVRTFNEELTLACTHGEPEAALAMLGSIEDLFAGFSLALGQALVHGGWLPPDEVVHYKTHQHLDLQHAEAFYALLDAPFAAGTEPARLIARGLEHGATVFLRLYEGLYEHALRFRA